MTEQELKRQRRVLDQSLSAHASLAERLRRRQKLLTLAILTLSIVAGSLAFAGDEHRLDLGFADASLPTCAGVLSAVVFALALFDLVVTWGATAGAHEDAARRLAVLKGQFTAARVEGGVVDTGTVDLESEYWNVMNSIAWIPNRHFVALKAEHLRKVEQSKRLEQTPTSYVWIMRLRLRLRLTGTWRALKQEAGEDQPMPFLEDEQAAPGREERRAI